MKRALTLAAVSTAVSVGLLAGCIADDSDATPTSRPTDTTSPGRTGTTSPDTTVPSTGPRIGGFGSSRLTFFGGCPALLNHLQAEALERVTAWGLGGGWRGYYPGGAVPDVAAADDATGGTEAPAATTPDYSGTNTQEVGVDEGDIVETNGTHVFVAGQDGVRIVEVERADVVETLRVPDGSHQLLLDGTRLLVVTRTWSGAEDTIVSLFDVADPDQPTLLRRSHLEGYVVATRAIDGTARLVLTSTIANRLPFVYPDQFGMDEDRALEENRRIIRESTIDEWLPRLFDEAGDGSYGAMTGSLDCTDVAAPREFAGLGISWIASVDMRAGSGPVGAAGVVSYGETVYASASNIYLATVPYDWYVGAVDDQGGDDAPPTLIHQFALGEGGSATYVASGEVEGQLLGQFAMSEHAGDLRVATTVEDWTGTRPSESFVQVLRPQGDELVQIGKVGGLGLTERIYAVRFIGTQGYVVTFRQTDPLYVVDLADPTNPVVTGELKIPGYSAYLHPVGEGLLLGVGQSATDDGRTTGTQLSLFDVSDPANPIQLSVLPIGGYSEVEWDHKAFLYWPEDGTIVIPVSPSWGDCGPQIDCLAGQITSPAGGVVVAQLEGTSLVARGTIQHENRSNSGCWNPLQRSIVIGAEIVTVGFDQVQFTDRATLVTRDQARWGDAEDYGCYYYGVEG